MYIISAFLNICKGVNWKKINFLLHFLARLHIGIQIVAEPADDIKEYLKVAFYKSGI